MSSAILPRMLPDLFSDPSPRQAVGELLFCSLIWGFAFVASRWALLGAGPFWTTALRFLLAFVAAYPLLRSNQRWRARASLEQLRLAWMPGFLIGLTLCLQTYGLQTTTITKSGFITVLYVVFVPLLEWAVLGRLPHRAHFFWVAVALVGAALICRLQAAPFSRGDLFTLACAFTAALHIIRLEKIADRIESAMVFNVYQSLWAGVLPLAFAWRLDPWPVWPPPALCLVGIAVLAFGSTLIAFMGQVRSQRVLPSSLVSMLFLLESPVAAFFGYLIFRERLSPSQWLGAGMILAAAAGSIWGHRAKSPANP